MIDVTLNAIKQRFIRLLTNVSECQVRWMPVAEPGRTTEKSLQPVPIIGAGKTPPSRRSVTQLGNDGGLEDYVNSTGWQTMLSQSAQCEERLCTRRQKIFNMLRDREFPVDRHTERFNRVNTRNIGNCWHWYIDGSSTSRWHENNFN